jgi:hypothetical protein
LLHIQICNMGAKFLLVLTPEHILWGWVGGLEYAGNDDPPLTAPAVKPYADLGVLLHAHARLSVPFRPRHFGDGSAHVGC